MFKSLDWPVEPVGQHSSWDPPVVRPDMVGFLVWENGFGDGNNSMLAIAVASHVGDHTRKRIRT